MNKIKKIVLTVTLLLVSVQFYAQKEHDYDKIKSLKIAFITERLDLTSKEAQNFWPIYNDYEDSRGALREKSHTEVRSKLKESEKLSEKEASAVIAKFLEIEQEEENIRKNYIKKAAGVISAKKALLLLRAEDEFKRQLIKKYHQKRDADNNKKS